ncbi:MAG: hypothetical protein R6W93_01045, partial [Candidatus Limnocylindrales bacterium]
LDPASRGTAPQVQDGVRLAADALREGGYVFEELEPPGIEEAARILLVTLSTPGVRAGWEESLRPIVPEPTRRFMSAFFGVAGEPDAVAVEQAFVSRHASADRPRLREARRRVASGRSGQAPCRALHRLRRQRRRVGVMPRASLAVGGKLWAARRPNGY